MPRPPFGENGDVAFGRRMATSPLTPIELGASPPRHNLKPLYKGGGELAPPPIGFPPLPPLVTPRTVAKCSRLPDARPVSPFSGWSPHKGYRYPSAYDAHPIVNEILAGDLSDQTKSEVGLDAFNYYVNRRPPPAQCQLDDLLWTIQIWAASNPQTLVNHMFHESLDKALGHHYPWAVFGKVKSLARRRDRRPW